MRRRFEAHGWQVLAVLDGNDLNDIERAIRLAREETEKPALISVRTHIGYGSPKQDSAEVHGEPLGAEALRATKERLGWSREPVFFIPPEALRHFRRAVKRGDELEREWQERLNLYRAAYPDLLAPLLRRV